MSFITNKGIIAVKAESTPYTAEALVSADADIRIFDASFTPEVEMHQHKLQAARYAQKASIVGKQTGTLTFSVNLTYSGTVDTAPKIGTLLQGCGALETVNASTSVVYTPSETKDAQPVSIWLAYKDSAATQSVHIFKMSGAMGNCVISFDNIGMPLKATFEFKGVMQAEAQSTTLIALTSPDTAVPDTTRSSTITVAAGASLIDSFSLDFGNTVEPITDPSKSQGVLGFQIVDRLPVMNITPEIQLAAAGDESTFPYYTNWVAGTTGAFSLATDKFAIAAPVVQVESYTPEDRNGAVIRNVTLNVLESSGNDEWSITHA